MDFNDTPEEAKFRAEVRAWLDKNATRKSDDTQSNRSRIDDPGLLKRAKEWQAKKAAAGYARITWPKEYGGLGGTPIQQVIYSQEETNYLVPLGFFDIGLGMCIPTVMAYAKPDVLARYVKPALYGEEIWCQLFSEPAAGSDVAGILTRAEKDGDGWVINGQKVWTSGAHYCDFGIIITRTDPNVAKHAGLTMFYLDMKSPGIEVRPIKQMSGAANFNEVFFTNVRVPDSQRLGKVGDGWKVALTTLMNERFAVGIPSGGPDVDELLDLARSVELEDGPAVRNAHVRAKIAEWYVQSQGLKYTKFRSLTALSKGQTPGPESSINKVVAAAKMQDLAAFAMELMGEGGLMTKDVPGAGGFQSQWFGGAGFRIAGGTDEILRNIIAERVLGLPQDVRVDKDISFAELRAKAGRGKKAAAS
jgi:acyl-CoA dehydrogenase